MTHESHDHERMHHVFFYYRDLVVFLKLFGHVPLGHDFFGAISMSIDSGQIIATSHDLTLKGS